MNYLKINNILYSPESIFKIDCSAIENLNVTVHTFYGEQHLISGIDAIDIVMRSNASMVEGKRFKFKKFAWVVHNLFGHPIMQLLSFIGLYKQAIWLHDVTIPKPINKKL